MQYLRGRSNSLPFWSWNWLFLVVVLIVNVTLVDHIFWTFEIFDQFSVANKSPDENAIRPCKKIHWVWTIEKWLGDSLSTLGGHVWNHIDMLSKERTADSEVERHWHSGRHWKYWWLSIDHVRPVSNRQAKKCFVCRVCILILSSSIEPSFPITGAPICLHHCEQSLSMWKPHWTLAKNKEAEFFE